jgi:hypothetical protein
MTSIADEARAQLALEARARSAGREPFAQRMIEGTDDALLRDIVRDNRHSVHQGTAIIPDAAHGAGAARPPVGENGWVTPPPMADWRPPGQAVFDRLMDAQDALDRAERTRRFNRLPLNGGE